jgi:microcystin-dependent protein
MEGMIAEIRMFGGNFAPKNWAFCNGQTIQIASNTALFSILGTTYGGNGTTTFQLPNLQGRIPVGAGQGPGLSYYVLGQVGGSESVTLNVNNLPAHTHSVIGTVTQGATANGGGDASPSGNYPANDGVANYNTTANTTTGNATANLTVGLTGSNTPMSVMQPISCVYYVICQYGIFPSRG